MTRYVSSVQVYVCLAFVVAIVAADQECDQSKCPGPLAYYKSLRCTPVYKNEGDCCAIKYNCDHLKRRTPDKCYVNDNVYEIGDKLKPEDSDPCDGECICQRGYDDVATFTCTLPSNCLVPYVNSKCYRRNNPTECCGGEDVCLENPEDRPTCIVDGVTYKDGDYFSIPDEPELTCICQPGYEGKNIEPFCIKSKRAYCSPEFLTPGNIYKNCAPIYYQDQSPQLNCSFSMRCQTDNDTVIHNHDESGEAPDEENVCLFGNLKMHIGDELSQGTDFTSACVKCVCEVPPVPTCQQLPYDKCDYKYSHIAF